MRRHLSASVLLHAVVLIALLFLQPRVPPRPHEEQSVRVEIVTLPVPKNEITKAKEPEQPVSAPVKESLLTAKKIIDAAHKQAPQKTRPASEAVDTLIAATELYSAQRLADPRSRSARAAMRQLAVDERVIQLCGLEAMEQVHRWRKDFKPDLVVAYAMADIKLTPHGLEAEGGAFHSRKAWYGIRFKCDVSPDDSKVVSFAFLVGKPIPRAQWADHNLTADENPAD